MESLCQPTMNFLVYLGLLIAFYGVVEGASSQSTVLFGDSLSDNGNGYAGNAMFVLRTNEAILRAF